MTRARIRSAIRIGLIVAVIASAVSWTPVVERLERSIGLTILYKLRGPLEPPPHTLVVAIDRASLDWLRTINSNTDPHAVAFIECLGRDAAQQLESVRDPTSVPRSVYACLLDRLTELGAALVVFDVMFSVRGPEKDDQKFARSIKKHGNVAMLVGFERSAVVYEGARLLIEQEVPPNQTFAAAAAATGSFVLPPVSMGVHGYFNRIAGMSDVRSLPSLAHERFLEKDGKRERSAVPSDRNALTYFWHYGPPGAVQTIPLWEVFEGRLEGSMLSENGNLAVFVGASDPTVMNFVDSFPSYFGGGIDPGVSGVELAATAFLNKVEGSTPVPMPAVISTSILAIFAFACAFSARLDNRYGYLIAFILLGLYLGAAHAIFLEQKAILPIAAPMFVAFPLALVAPTFARYRVANRLIKRLAPAQIGSRMLDEGEERRGGAETEEATIVFTD